MLPARIESAFEGQPLVTFTFQDRACWIARDLGRLLGYSDDGTRLARKVAGEWAEEMIEGQDFAIVTGAELALLREIAGTESVPTMARSMVLLFESGVHLACIKSRSEAGRKLRRFLADEVLPQLVRTGRFEADAAAPAPTEEFRQRKADLLFAIAGKLEQFGNLSAPAKAELYARCYREATGEAAPALLPVVDSHPHTLTSMGVALGLSSQKVGRIARDIGVYDAPSYCQVRLSKSPHSDRQVEQRFFNDAGRALIERFVRGSKAA